MSEKEIRLRRALEEISSLIQQDYREGDKEYQVVIIASNALNKTKYVDMSAEQEEEMFSYRREGIDD